MSGGGGGIFAFVLRVFREEISAVLSDIDCQYYNLFDEFFI